MSGEPGWSLAPCGHLECTGRGHCEAAPFTVPNAEGVAAMHQARRDRKRQRDLHLCCDDGCCDTCSAEAEAIKADQAYEDRYGRDY